MNKDTQSKPGKPKQDLWSILLRRKGGLPDGYAWVPGCELAPAVLRKRAAAINKANKRRNAKIAKAFEDVQNRRKEKRKLDTRTVFEHLLDMTLKEMEAGVAQTSHSSNYPIQKWQ